MTYQTEIITVFGGSGMIGRHLVVRLARRGALIRVASRHPGQARFLKTAGEAGQVQPIAVDITNEQSVALAVKDATAVINLVGVLYESGRWTFQAVHAEAPARIARAAAAAGVEQLVQISAIGADPASNSAYSRTKAAGESAVLAAFPGATILRPSVIFGPEDHFFNLFASMALISPVLPLLGGGKTRFQPVFVGDVAEAITTALTNPETHGKTYELGGPDVHSFKELMEIMLAEIGRKRLLVTLPFELAKWEAALILERLPKPLLTRDQIELFKSDNVVQAGALTLADLGITPTALDLVLPTYLDRFRPGGRFGLRPGACAAKAAPTAGAGQGGDGSPRQESRPEA